MFKPTVGLLFVLGLLAGCGKVVVFGHVIGEERTATEVSAQPAPALATETKSTESTPRPAPATGRAVSDVTVQITPQAADERFHSAALTEAIKNELSSRRLLNPDAYATAEVSIDGVKIEPASNAVLFGYVISNGTLNGELLVREAGAGSPPQRIDARAKLSIAANGTTKEPLDPLYRRFAVLTADRLAGVASADPDDSVNQQLYR
jgi:hypothetical protein